MKSGESQIREALQRVGGETVRVEGRNGGNRRRDSGRVTEIYTVIPLDQKDFGFFPLLSPKDQTMLIQKVHALRGLLRKSVSHTRELKNDIKKLEGDYAALEEKYIGLSSSWNELLRKTPDKDR